MMDATINYVIMENVLTKINQKYIALPEADVKRNSFLIRVVNKIIDKLKTKSSLFKNLYQSIYYGGSFYDKLKVGEPSEYDLDWLLVLPKIVNAQVQESDKPGYVHVVLNDLELLKKKKDETPKYVGLTDLLDGKRLSTSKVLNWMESQITLVLNEFKKNKSSPPEVPYQIEETTYLCRVMIKKSGPSLTLCLEGDYSGSNFKVDIDLVTCFVFKDDQWPKKMYRENPSALKKTFFVVPKSPNLVDTSYWRLSFQEQEKELLSGYKSMKPTIRLIKKLRDRHYHKIASYYIKTVFLWELQKDENKALWDKQLSVIFMTMLEKYCEYIKNRKIPYFWNEDCNLIGGLNDVTADCIANKLSNIIKDVNRNIVTNPFIVSKYLLFPTELGALKEGVTLGKRNPSRNELLMPVNNCPNTEAVTEIFENLVIDGGDNSSSSYNGEDTVGPIKIGSVKVAAPSDILNILQDITMKMDSIDKKVDCVLERQEEHELEVQKKLIAINTKIDLLLKHHGVINSIIPNELEQKKELKVIATCSCFLPKTNCLVEDTTTQ